tara:strand:+ start:2515 stop:2718 length:204 start_codon:yes stop_codon:yes gene_type:complete
MKVDIKSFLIGVLATINLFLLYGFTNSANCDTYYDADDIMKKVKRIEKDVKSIKSEVGSIYTEIMFR